jgi:uncharacterized protein YsxB (DUF464 family)
LNVLWKPSRPGVFYWKENMIDIKISSNQITVSGHAGHAPPGYDIVCAAVSTLVQTLAASIEELTGGRIEHDIQHGSAVIRYKDLTAESKLLIESFFIGVSGVAESCPECVRVSREA